MRLKLGWLLLLGCATNVGAAGHLVVEQAWIRAAPPDAPMLAGYATLKNDGDAPVVVTGASSADFGDVSLHESFSENGVERMRQLGNVSIAPGASVVFTPGGKHFMLMDAKRALKSGDWVKIHISTKSGTGADADFVVRDFIETSE
ncbi:MAG: copper chaperone PCu(A)C [Xanthomonadaceae bacterium]|nr:copper chaperone PCu(A)C [Xanthomonadaceae bacterium]MDE1884396.1 copper chaperone PCu(A)C [Xanthomonadaceae bacterium]MDE1960997.1 copper chaperone PCu(A)C [Xanthomonadaceae bacterium]MDE2083714.1 copper chaperone PCu(A)C [Xanthomonadaceae bacterium]